MKLEVMMKSEFMMSNSEKLDSKIGKFSEKHDNKKGKMR